MIHTHESQQQQLQAFEQACRESGLKVTHQRLMIFRELVLTPDHPTAEQLHQRIRKSIPTISLDTIYRTLATFEEHGLVNRVDTQQSQAHFEAAGTGHAGAGTGQDPRRAGGGGRAPAAAAAGGGVRRGNQRY